MQATLIYNPNAGGLQVTPDELQEALRQVGYEPVYIATSKEQDLDPILAETRGLVVVAGGDGSVRAVATRLVGRGLPLAILPLGTANNVAQTLGIVGTPSEIITGLREPQKQFFDMGYVHASWGDDYFLEAMGYGFYADTLAIYEPEKGKSILRGLTALTQTLNNYQSHICRLVLDGEDISGSYLMVEVLNTTAFGPRLKFAPQADPSDGLFEVVRIREDKREGFLTYITSIVREEIAELPSVEVSSGRKLEIYWTGFPLHIDAEVRPVSQPHPIDEPPAPGARPAAASGYDCIVSAEILPQVLEIWLPSSETV